MSMMSSVGSRSGGAEVVAFLYVWQVGIGE